MAEIATTSENTINENTTMKQPAAQTDESTEMEITQQLDDMLNSSQETLLDYTYTTERETDKDVDSQDTTDNETTMISTREKNKVRNYYQRATKEDNTKVKNKKDEALRDKIQLMEQTIKTLRKKCENRQTDNQETIHGNNQINRGTREIKGKHHEKPANR